MISGLYLRSFLFCNGGEQIEIETEVERIETEIKKVVTQVKRIETQET